MDLLLRTLERRFRGDDPRDGSQYLRWLERAAAPEPERLRLRLELGELTVERLRLAAYAGHRPARAALAALGAAAPGPARDLERWVLGLADFGKQPCAVAAAAAAAAALPAFERRRPRDSRPHEVVAAAERFLVRPDPAHAAALERAVWDATFAGPFLPVAQGLGACAIGLARDDVPPLEGAARAADAATAAEDLGGLAVRRAIRAALAAWALNGRPPRAA